ncbi:hypothetical protein Syun_028231 [Stephania yunnanensis]|uniref:RRM domain-containing protein n=1 Tax=Stephania yunnanensis TaxID=152371 RepID=A0AAP0EJH7_9MAGN
MLCGDSPQIVDILVRLSGFNFLVCSFLCDFDGSSKSRVDFDLGKIKPPSSPAGRFTQILSVRIGGSALGPLKVCLQVYEYLHRVMSAFDPELLIQRKYMEMVALEHQYTSYANHEFKWRRLIGPEMPSSALLAVAAKLTEAEAALSPSLSMYIQFREVEVETDLDLFIGPPPPAIVVEAESANEAERFDEFKESDLGKLFIGGISWDTNEDRLKDYFQNFGEVVEAVIMKDWTTGRARGFGFVVFADPAVYSSFKAKTIHPLICSKLGNLSNTRCKDSWRSHHKALEATFLLAR